MKYRWRTGIVLVVGSLILAGCQKEPELGGSADTRRNSDPDTSDDSFRDTVYDTDSTRDGEDTDPDGVDARRDALDSSDVPDGGDSGDTCSDPSRQQCGGACVDLSTSRDHCGECSNPCPTDHICQNGTCTNCTSPERCPTHSTKTTCESRECRAVRCEGFRHPCDDRTKCCDWTSLGTVDSVERTSVALAYGGGDTFVSYWEEPRFDARNVHLATHTGGTDWTIERVDDKQRAGIGLSMAVDAQGQPHLIYKWDYDRNVHLNRVRYAVRSNGGWQFEQAHEDITNQTMDLALDATDSPQLIARVHTESGGSTQLGYARRTGPDNWTTEALDPRNVHLYDDGLELDANGRPHVAVGLSTDGVRYVRRRSTNDWVFEVVDDASYKAGYGDIELTAGDEPRIVYEFHRRDRILFAEPDTSGSGWSTTEISSGGSSPQLVVDGDGHLRIYFAAGDQLKAARRIEGTWHVKTLRSASTDIQDLFAAVDGDGEPGLAYSTETAIEVIEW